jgi:hypothetical protein
MVVAEVRAVASTPEPARKAEWMETRLDPSLPLMTTYGEGVARGHRPEAGDRTL